MSKFKSFIKSALMKSRAYWLLVVAGFLWKTGGSGYKWARRFVYPAVLTAVCYFTTHNILASIATFGFAMTFSLGYGIPDQSWVDHGVGDEGSVIARFFLKFTKNLRVVRILTRTVCGIAYSTICLPAILTGDKVWWDMLGLALTVPAIVELDLGEIEEVAIGTAIMAWFLKGLIF